MKVLKYDAMTNKIILISIISSKRFSVIKIILKINFTYSWNEILVVYNNCAANFGIHRTLIVWTLKFYSCQGKTFVKFVNKDGSINKEKVTWQNEIEVYGEKYVGRWADWQIAN